MPKFAKNDHEKRRKSTKTVLKCSRKGRKSTEIGAKNIHGFDFWVGLVSLNRDMGGGIRTILRTMILFIIIGTGRKKCRVTLR
jgi:hypothetical protein